MKKIRTVLWIAIAVLGGLLGYSYLTQGSQNSIVQTAKVSIGGPFDLITSKGKRITHTDLKGRPHAIFFGFTHCPEICPTALFEMSGWMKELGKDGDKFDIYFLTVDPERDTAEILANYMSAFDGRITAITGEPEKMAEAIKAYRAYAKRVELDDGDYTMDHTATVYLMKADGSFTGTIDYSEDASTAVAKLRRLIKDS